MPRVSLAQVQLLAAAVDAHELGPTGARTRTSTPEYPGWYPGVPRLVPLSTLSTPGYSGSTAARPVRARVPAGEGDSRECRRWQDPLQ